jgi:nitroreductase
MTTSETIAHIIKTRRAVYPANYSDQPITPSEIDQVLTAAHWAPTHRRTEPWRFVVLHSPESRKMLGTFIAEYYKSTVDEEVFSEATYQKPIINTAKSGCIIVIALLPDTLHRVPEWEELCAVACATQNMWLMCTALGIGAYWSSHQSVGLINEKIGLSEDHRVLGYFYMGHLLNEPAAGTRGNLEEKVRYL